MNMKDLKEKKYIIVNILKMPYIWMKYEEMYEVVFSNYLSIKKWLSRTQCAYLY